MSDGRSDDRNSYDIKSKAPPSRKEREKDGAPAVKKRQPLLTPPSNQTRAVGPAKPERVGHRVVERCLPRVVGDEVHVARAGVLVFEIDGGRKDLVAQGEHGDAGFEASGTAQQMSSHGLGR